MMDKLVIAATEDTPDVKLDRENNEFRISGRSYPENSRTFFEPIASWFVNYLEQPNPLTNLVIELDYFNSGSLKEIYTILYIMEDISERGVDAKITWCYKTGDELMKQKGEEFQDMLELPVELKEV